MSESNLNRFFSFALPHCPNRFAITSESLGQLTHADLSYVKAQVCRWNDFLQLVKSKPADASCILPVRKLVKKVQVNKTRVLTVHKTHDVVILFIEVPCVQYLHIVIICWFWQCNSVYILVCLLIDVFQCQLILMTTCLYMFSVCFNLQRLSSAHSWISLHSSVYVHYIASPRLRITCCPPLCLSNVGRLSLSISFSISLKSCTYKNTLFHFACCRRNFMPGEQEAAAQMLLQRPGLRLCYSTTCTKPVWL